MRSIVQALAELRTLDLARVSVEDVKHQLMDVFPVLVMQRVGVLCPSVWRARATGWGERLHTIRDLWYPPADSLAPRTRRA